MAVKRKDFQKAAALIHEFLLKLADDLECAELRDALNLSLLHMQRYYRRLRTRMHTLDKQSNGNHILSQSLRGLSPMTPFRDAPDKFQWKWINLDNPKLHATLPVDYNKEVSCLPPVIQAAKAGDNALLMEHIERDPDCVFEVDGMGRTALMYAVNFGHLDSIQVLLENGIDMNTTANDGSTAVHRACHDGHHEALQILIEYDADLQLKDAQGRTPIHWACAYKERECLRLLLESDRQIDPSSRDNDGMTPSMWACRMDNIEHFELLTSAQTTIDDGIEKENNGRTWMHWSVRRTEPLECLKTLLTEDSAMMKDEEGKTVVHIATEMGALQSVKIAMEIAGKQILDQRDSQNRTPLILATIGGHGEVVNYLLAEGADLMCVDNDGASAWDYACKRQLHYCMLIHASYIRQRTREEEEGLEGNSEYNAISGMMDGTLGLDHLQINGHAGDQPMLHGHRPAPPPYPPSEPPTPRTPRTPRPKTPGPRRNGVQQVITPRVSQIEPRHPSSGGVKRSTSTPDANETTFFERNQIKPSSMSSSKRLKNEHSPDRDALISVMSVESGDQPPSRLTSAQSIRSNHSNHSNRSKSPHEEEMANDSQYVDNDDDHSRVSIDAMDVSDFEPDEENGEKVAQQPAPSPRPPPQPHPRANQPKSPPFTYAPKTSLTRGTERTRSPPPPPKKTHTKITSYHAQRAMQGALDEPPPEAYVEASENGYHDEEPVVSDVDHARSIHFPQGSLNGSGGGVVPPAHLLPLGDSSMPPPARKKKKKKKKDRPQHVSTYQDFPKSSSYVAPIPPPLHHNKHPPSAHMGGSYPPSANKDSPSLHHGGGGMVGGNVRPSSGHAATAKPLPKKRNQEQRFRHFKQDEYVSDEDDAPLKVQGSGKRFQNSLNTRMPQQNGLIQKRPPMPNNRSDPIPSPRSTSARGRRPPSGSLGGNTQHVSPWTNQTPSDKLPPP